MQAIVDRHEILRTTFVAVDGRPWQAVAPTLRIDLPLEDLSELPEAEQVVTVEQRIANHLALPFDLRAGPLIRARVLRLSPTEHALVVTAHHTVSDHWSSGVFWDELQALYQAEISGKSAELPEVSLQYADFAEWQREWLQGPELAAQLRYWREQLTGAAHVLELSTDFPRPAQFSHNGAHATFYLPADLVQALSAFAQREGVTLFMVMLAVYQILLLRYSGQTDFIIGSPVAGRTRAELEPLIGPFVNTLALRANLSGDPTFRAVLRQVRETCLGALEHQETPLEKIIEDLNPERNLSYTPLFQVFFGLQHAAIGNQFLGDLTLCALDRNATTAKADLGLTITDHADKIYGDVE
jgi:hypothetical protein